MVLQTERYNGGFQQQSYSSYQGPNGNYSNFQGVSEYASPYPGSFQGSTYPSSHGSHHQSGWSSGGDYYGNGSSHYPGAGMIAPMKPTPNYESSYCENSYTHGSPNPHGHRSPHGHGHGGPHGHDLGSPNHHGHDSLHNQGHGSGPHSFGKPQSFGGAITNQINKLTQGHNNYGTGSPHNHGHGSPDHQGHGSPYGSGKTQGFGGAMTHGHNTYGSGGPNYGHSSSGFNPGYHQQQQPSWTLKGLEDDE